MFNRVVSNKPVFYLSSGKPVNRFNSILYIQNARIERVIRELKTSIKKAFGEK
jgi:hypothetical protein